MFVPNNRPVKVPTQYFKRFHPVYMLTFEHVLLVDDNAATNFLHKRTLRKSGRVRSSHAVQSATEGLMYLQQEEATVPDLILLDINMPGMTGWDFVEAFCQWAAGRHRDTRVVFLTTSLNPDDVAHARTLDCVHGFMEKPLTLEMVDQLAEGKGGL